MGFDTKKKTLPTILFLIKFLMFVYKRKQKVDLLVESYSIQNTTFNICQKPNLHKDDKCKLMFIIAIFHKTRVSQILIYKHSFQ